MLADLVAADPGYFHGLRACPSVRRQPDGLGRKYLDSARAFASFKFIPTLDFSRRQLGTGSGKTEAYYILGTRPEVAEPFIYLGFQKDPPKRADLRRMTIVEQDIAALEQCFDKIPVNPGDAYVVPGGLPHAIGGGVLMVEVMEPTDFVARVEFNVAGRIIPDSARFMGRDVDFALDMISFETLPVSVVQSRWRCRPRTIEAHSGVRRESLVDDRLTDRFNVIRTTLTGRNQWHRSGFTVLLVVEGSCSVGTPDEEIQLHQFDRIVVPHGLESLEINPENRVVLLENCPPA